MSGALARTPPDIHQYQIQLLRTRRRTCHTMCSKATNRHNLRSQADRVHDHNMPTERRGSLAHILRRALSHREPSIRRAPGARRANIVAICIRPPSLKTPSNQLDDDEELDTVLEADDAADWLELELELGDNAGDTGGPMTALAGCGGGTTAAATLARLVGWRCLRPMLRGADDVATFAFAPSASS